MGSHASGNDYMNAKVTFMGHIVGKDGQYGKDGTRVLWVRCKPWVQIIKQAWKDSIILINTILMQYFKNKNSHQNICDE